MLIEAGTLFNGHRFIEQPLPYGTVPRLIMVHVSSEAVRTQQRIINIGDSARQFLTQLGLHSSGGPRGGYTALRQQVRALAACRLVLGTSLNGRAITVDAKPFHRFEAWLPDDSTQSSLWPGQVELSHEFFNSLCGHAVPLDPRALAVLKHTALGLDVYAWLAHRLCRVTKANGVRLSWQNLREQFGQEYADRRNFKKAFRRALRQATTVYPDARISEAPGGVILLPSRPPLARSFIAVSPSPQANCQPVDNPLNTTSCPR